MIKVTINTNGTDENWEISNMETLAKFQAHLTEQVIEQLKSEIEISEEQRMDIIHNYLQEAEDDFSIRCDLVEEIENNMPRVFDEVIERALRDTDYDTIDEMTDAIENRNTALYDIYEIAREYA